MPALYPTPTILTLSLPPSTFVGIDVISFTSNTSFQGIKNLPPGPHFLFTGTTDSLSIRSGSWFFVPRSSEPVVLIWSWDAERESLIPEKKAEVLMRAKANLGSIWDNGLMPYTQSVEEEAEGDWSRLTDCITQSLLDRILDGDTDSQKGRWTISSVSSAPQDADVIPGLTSSESVIEGEQELHFLPIDLKRTWREGAIGRERTEAAQDRSWALGDLIDKFSESGERKTGAQQILGEMQFAFLMVLTISNYSCLEQWKRILGLLLTCKRALGEIEAFFVKVVGLLQLQLEHCKDVEGAMFDLSDEGGALLKKLLTSFRKNAQETLEDDQSQLKEELKDLLQFVQDEYGWDLESPVVQRGMLELEDGERIEMQVENADEEEETGEYAPVIVDLDGASPDMGGRLSH